jgi:L-fucose mutarotase
MLKGMSKLLTGDLLKILCDMGHGDELVIVDGNFPGVTMAKRLVSFPGIDAVTLLREIVKVFPLDTYCEAPAAIMRMTDSDQASGMATPAIWGEFDTVMKNEFGPDTELAKIERFEFYERSKKAYAIVQSGEERIYGNIILSKGVVK